MKLLCIVTNGFEEVELCGTIGILRRAKVDIDIYSLHSTSATGRYGLTVSNLLSLDKLNLNDYDGLFIAGGPEYVELEQSKIFKDIILDFADKNKLISAICAGPTILGHLGLLKNKKYTCFSSMNEDFSGTYLDAYCVEDGNFITGKSAAATIDFAFKIVEHLYGTQYAEQVKNSIYYYSK